MKRRRVCCIEEKNQMLFLQKKGQEFNVIGQFAPSGSTKTDQSSGDDTPGDNNIMRGSYDDGVAADYDSAAENTSDDDTDYPTADDDPTADDHPTADDDTEVLSPGPKKQLSSREHGLWRVNEKLFKRWHTKMERVNRLVKAWDKQKPVAVGDKVLLPFEDLLQHNKQYWCF
jgi:hypothetical protein